MADLCNECLRPIKPFEICDHGKNSAVADAAFPWGRIPSKGASAASPWLLVAAPFGGVVLDWILPVWSFLPLTAVLCLVGSVPFAYVWVKQTVGIPRSFGLLWRFVTGAVLAPISFKSNLEGKNFRRFSLLWCLSLLFAFALVQSVATPVNMAGLTQQIHGGVQKRWNIGVEVHCGAPQIAIPGSELTCTASKRVLIQINLPAKVRVKNVLGQVSWNISMR